MFGKVDLMMWKVDEFYGACVNTSKRNDKYGEISAYLKLNVVNIREIKLLPTLIQLIGISLES